MIIDRFWRALAVAALAGLLGACQTPAPSPAAPPLAKPDRIMLLPQADGSASALIVQSQSGEEVTLSQPDATASVGASRVAIVDRRAARPASNRTSTAWENALPTRRTEPC